MHSWPYAVAKFNSLTPDYLTRKAAIFVHSVRAGIMYRFTKAHMLRKTVHLNVSGAN